MAGLSGVEALGVKDRHLRSLLHRGLRRFIDNDRLTKFDSGFCGFCLCLVSQTIKTEFSVLELFKLQFRD